MENRVQRITGDDSGLGLVTNKDDQINASSERGDAPHQEGIDLHQTPHGKKETGGPSGPEPTRYGDWERKGRCIDF